MGPRAPLIKQTELLRNAQTTKQSSAAKGRYLLEAAEVPNAILLTLQNGAGTPNVVQSRLPPSPSALFTTRTGLLTHAKMSRPSSAARERHLFREDVELLSVITQEWQTTEASPNATTESPSQSPPSSLLPRGARQSSMTKLITKAQLPSTAARDTRSSTAEKVKPNAAPTHGLKLGLDTPVALPRSQKMISPDRNLHRSSCFIS